MYEQINSDGNKIPIATATYSISLPSYALDGRELTWNADRSAVSFESTDAEYHSDDFAASASSLKIMDRSAAHLLDKRQSRYNGSPSKPSAAMTFGTGLHCAVLEPDVFQQRYVTYTGKETATTRSTQAFKRFVQNQAPKRVLLQAELQKIIRCSSTALSTPVVRTDTDHFTLADLVDIGNKELNYYWVDDQTGVTCKARMDLTLENIILDLKTAKDARHKPFMYDAAKFGYHLQAAFYINGYAKFTQQRPEDIVMIFLVVENESPFACAVFQADKDTFWDVGRKRVAELLKQYKECVQTQRWPAYDTGPQLLKLPLSKLYEAPKFNFNY